MSALIDNGGCAFPRVHATHGTLAEGMTLRDWFAGQLIISMALRDLRRFQRDDGAESENLTVFDNSDMWQDAAKEAYAIADAMIAARKGGQA